MTYDEAVEILGVLKPGGSIPTAIPRIMKLVLGKMARRKINEAKRTAEITVGGNTEFLLSTYIPDFFALKLDGSSKNRGPFFYQSSEPYYIYATTKSEFEKHTEGGYCMVEDGTLKVKFPLAPGTIETLYVPIWGKFLVLDEEGGTLKETPENGGDTFIFNSVFDDVFIDGCLLYLNRKDLSDKEYIKAKQEWTNSLNELVFYG